jgi:hypothetical protein
LEPLARKQGWRMIDGLETCRGRDVCSIELDIDWAAHV